MTDTVEPTAGPGPADDTDLDESLIGHYAGAATRLAAFAIDGIISVGVFNIAVAAGIWILGLFTPLQVHRTGSPWWLVPLGIWLFIYYWYSYTLSGKTPGKALLGLRVVRGDGSDVDGVHAAIRVLTFPLSWLSFGLGFIGIVIGSRRRALHDVIADTAVVYDFDARAAHLRFLVRQTRATPGRAQ